MHIHLKLPVLGRVDWTSTRSGSLFAGGFLDLMHQRTWEASGFPCLRNCVFEAQKFVQRIVSINSFCSTCIRSLVIIHRYSIFQYSIFILERTSHKDMYVCMSSHMSVVKLKFILHLYVTVLWKPHRGSTPKAMLYSSKVGTKTIIGRL